MPEYRIISDSDCIYLGNISGLEKIWGLEDLLVGHTVLLGRAQEGLDVLHEKEGRALRSGRDRVGERVVLFGMAQVATII